MASSELVAFRVGTAQLISGQLQEQLYPCPFWPLRYVNCASFEFVTSLRWHYTACILGYGCNCRPFLFVRFQAITVNLDLSQAVSGSIHVCGTPIGVQQNVWPPAKTVPSVMASGCSKHGVFSKRVGLQKGQSLSATTQPTMILASYTWNCTYFLLSAG